MNNKELLDLHKRRWQNTADIEHQDIKPYLHKFKMLDDLAPAGTGFFIIINLSTYQYEFIGSNQPLVSGYDNEYVRNEGIKFQMDHIHPEDGEHILKKGYEKFQEIGFGQTEVERKNMMMQSNYRFRHKDGHFIHLVEQNQLTEIHKEQDQKCNYILTYICEIPAIDPFKGNIIIKKLNGENREQEILYKGAYPDTIPEMTLSERELDIVRLLAKGSNSNQIAEKLFISPHTVRTHRKNMLSKLGLNSANEMVAYAITKGML